MLNRDQCRLRDILSFFETKKHTKKHTETYTRNIQHTIPIVQVAGGLGVGSLKTARVLVVDKVVAISRAERDDVVYWYLIQ